MAQPTASSQPIVDVTERDLPLLDLPHAPAPSALGRFWAMLAHLHAEVLNWSELGRSMGRLARSVCRENRLNG